MHALALAAALLAARAAANTACSSSNSAVGNLVQKGQYAITCSESQMSQGLGNYHHDVTVQNPSGADIAIYSSDGYYCNNFDFYNYYPSWSTGASGTTQTSYTIDGAPCEYNPFCCTILVCRSAAGCNGLTVSYSFYASEASIISQSLIIALCVCLPCLVLICWCSFCSRRQSDWYYQRQLRRQQVLRAQLQQPQQGQVVYVQPQPNPQAIGVSHPLSTAPWGPQTQQQALPPGYGSQPGVVYGAAPTVAYRQQPYYNGGAVVYK